MTSPAGGDISSFLRGLDLADQRIRKAVTKGVNELGEQLLGDAQELAPVDTGDLKGSANARPAVVTATRVEKEVGFYIEYAAYVHERLDMHFNTVKNPKAQAKFLETAARRMAPKAAPHLAKLCQQALTGGSQ